MLAPAGERLLAQARRLLSLNDDVWSSMRTPSFEGEVRLGVPYDIIASFVPPILRRFAKAQPRVRVSLVCEDSRVVREQLRSGGVDLALTTETECGRHGETLRTDRLVWVGVPGGDAHLKDPLPVSLGAPTCVFRPVAVEALGKARRDWRAVCEVSRMEPVYAVLEAGLAVAPLLRSSVPERFEIFEGKGGREARLPAAAGIPHQSLRPAGPEPRRARSRRPCPRQLRRACPRPAQQLIRSDTVLSDPVKLSSASPTGCRCVSCSDGCSSWAFWGWPAWLRRATCSSGCPSRCWATRCRRWSGSGRRGPADLENSTVSGLRRISDSLK